MSHTGSTKRTPAAEIETCSCSKRTKGDSKAMTDSGSSESVDGEFSTSRVSDDSLVVGFDQTEAREILAKMILAHGLPFSIVEFEWFNQLSSHLNPFHQKVSENTIKQYCVKVFESERDKIKKVLQDVHRISLACDYWTSSDQTTGYLCLTAHYIDADWKLQKRIICFNELSLPYNGEIISNAIMDCLVKWGIENKIITITSALDYDGAPDILRSRLEARGALHFQGFFFHLRCCAHILNSVVQDGFNKIESCLSKIREGVEYLGKEPHRLVKFREVAIQLDISTHRSLWTDVKTRWNSTYRMLQSAIYYKTVFIGYASSDPNYEWLPTDVEWENAEKVCKLVEGFGVTSLTTTLFSNTLYPTSNLLLIEIFGVKKEICEAYLSADGFTRGASISMFEKFEKYWDDVSLLIAVASILDPRFKQFAIQFCFEKVYSSSEASEQVKCVLAKLRVLYEMYEKEYISLSVSSSSLSIAGTRGTSSSVSSSSINEDFISFMQSKWAKNPPKSDLDIYLEEPVFKRKELDVLTWWRENSVKFPILSKLAHDVLCIPTTTATSESDFSVGSRVLDNYQSSLRKDMIEILVCGGDWIRASTKSESHTLQEAAMSEENLEIQIPATRLTNNQT
ncbi:Zinc finger BED domain-containing protein RICESLEEPER 2 [Rhynchospora pubera]|uniref:Zinc finger BED domain-containing protein RICESLEEPER 2 n=1 Tax=Rhynchospora pubera TaxID=906938 RepID=A0AAV8EPH2_9POAL|nr:Zinc finger BED domain-containing protein RICESLEEPER 2 [Rhynchospora pubera]